MKVVFKTTGGAATPTPGGPATPPGGASPAREPVHGPVTAAAGDVIFSEGELGTEMYIILEGDVHIVKHLVGGETRTLSKLEKGDFFGEMAVLESVPRTADAVAATEVKLLAINGSRFDDMLRKNPEIAVRIIRKYSKRLREANALIGKLAGPDVDSDNPPFPEAEDVQLLSQNFRLVDVATGNAFFFSRGSETTIGRADPVTGILPDVDLTEVDVNRSVSRRHAKIIRNGEEYLMLEEVGSVNGTFVNDQRIPTGQPVPIQNGDQVKIGLVEMKVIFD